MQKVIYTGIVAILFLIGCNNQSGENDDSSKSNADSISIKHNCDHLIMATLWFQKSAEMRACYIQAYNWAKRSLDEQMEYTSRNKKPAIVLDIDETVLDNSPFEVKCIETGEGYSTETWQAWTSKEMAVPLPGTVEFLNYANEKGVEIFYISNRKVDELGWTLANMKKYELPNADSAHVILRAETGSKKARREQVLKDHEIILLIGDALTDFSEIYESRDSTLGFDLVDADKDKFGFEYIIIPNPMYGEWEKAVFHNSYDYTTEQKDSLRRNILNSY